MSRMPLAVRLLFCLDIVSERRHFASIQSYLRALL